MDDLKEEKTPTANNVTPTMKNYLEDSENMNDIVGMILNNSSKSIGGILDTAGKGFVNKGSKSGKNSSIDFQEEMEGDQYQMLED